jgi:tripartite-type tricarboxylate transporter receptor subunit TctC
MQTMLRNLFAATTLLITASGAGADPVADFFRGQTISIIVGSEPGGGYDSYARPVAHHLGRLIPGNPTVTVKYMPGAASLVAANYLFNVAPRDGTQIGALQRQIPIEPLRGNDAVRYDPFRFYWLGSVTAETSVFVVAGKAPQHTPSDLLTQHLIAASLGPGTDSEVESIAMARLDGAPIQLISGYRGTPEALLALDRGEVQGVHGISWSYIKARKADALKDGSIRLILQSALHPHPDLPNLPMLSSLAKSDEERQVWDLILAPKVMSRPYLLPPDVPPERAAALRKAFEDLMTDPAFLDEMKKLQLEVIPAKAADIEALMKRLYAFPPKTIARMRAAISLQAN